jgi:hypothetical protein
VDATETDEKGAGVFSGEGAEKRESERAMETKRVKTKTFFLEEKEKEGKRESGGSQPALPLFPPSSPRVVRLAHLQ